MPRYYTMAHCLVPYDPKAGPGREQLRFRHLSIAVTPSDNIFHLRDHGWRNRGGGGRDLPPGPVDSITWVGPEGTQYITKMDPFTFLELFFSNCNSCIGVFGPFKILGDPFPRGPPRPSPPHLWNHFPSPVRDWFKHFCLDSRMPCLTMNQRSHMVHTSALRVPGKETCTCAPLAWALQL